MQVLGPSDSVQRDIFPDAAPCEYIDFGGMCATAGRPSPRIPAPGRCRNGLWRDLAVLILCGTFWRGGLPHANLRTGSSEFDNGCFFEPPSSNPCGNAHSIRCGSSSVIANALIHIRTAWAVLENVAVFREDYTSCSFCWASWNSQEEFWVAVKEFSLSYHNPETMLFTIYPYHGNLIEVP